MATTIQIDAAYDDEADVWFVERSDLAGLRIEAATMDGLMQRLPGAVYDLLETGDPEKLRDGVTISVTAHRDTNIRLEAA